MKLKSATKTLRWIAFLLAAAAIFDGMLVFSLYAFLGLCVAVGIWVLAMIIEVLAKPKEQ